MRLFKSKLLEIFSLDLRSLALFRIGVAGVLLCDLIVRASDLRMFYTDAGVLPRALLLSTPGNLWFASLHFVNGSFFFQAVLFLITGLAALALLVGYRTPWMTSLCWLLTASLHARNHLVCQGGDDYLRMILFWSQFVPLGARYSLDSLLRSSPPPPKHVASWGTAALLLQTVYLYLSTSIFKSRGSNWMDGSALFYVLNIDCFVKRPAFFLLLFPRLLRYLTWGVLAQEGLGPYLLLSPIWNGPLRTIAVLGFIGLHAGIMMTMSIGPFQWVSIIAVIAFLPIWFWDQVTPAKAGVQKIIGTWIPASAGMTIKKLISSWPRHPLRIQSSVLSPYLILASLACVTAWDVSALYPTHRLPPWLSEICYTFGFKQGWSMFAPNITKSSGWFVVPGKLQNGKLIDLLRDGAPLSWAPPELISESFGNERRRKYLMNMRIQAHASFQNGFSRYLCQSWNAAHPGNDRLQSLEFIFMDRLNKEGYMTSDYDRHVYWETYCSPEDRSAGSPLPSLVTSQEEIQRLRNIHRQRRFYQSPYVP